MPEVVVYRFKCPMCNKTIYSIYKRQLAALATAHLIRVHNVSMREAAEIVEKATVECTCSCRE